jgi:hypothetical protein
MVTLRVLLLDHNKIRELPLTLGRLCVRAPLSLSRSLAAVVFLIDKHAVQRLAVLGIDVTRLAVPPPEITIGSHAHTIVGCVTRLCVQTCRHRGCVVAGCAIVCQSDPRRSRAC